MTALLERVKFIGGNGGGEGPNDEPLPGMPEQPEAGPALDADPEPDKKARRRPRNTGPAAGRPAGRAAPRNAGKFTSRATMVKNMADELDAYAKALALAWSMSDPVCAPVLSEQSRAIADSLAALLGRSDWVMQRFEQTTVLADSFRLLSASLPVLRAVYVHHVAERGREEGDGHDAVTFDTAEYPAYGVR